MNADELTAEIAEDGLNTVYLSRVIPHSADFRRLRRTTRLALKVTAANEQERAQVADLVEEVQQATGENVEVAFVDQGYTGKEPAEQAAKRGIRLIVVKLEEAKKGFVLLPRRWVVARSFAWAARFRRLAKDYERLPSSLAGLHWLAFLILMLNSIFHQSS
jgi:transposase